MQHARWSATGSSIRHVKARALGVNVLDIEGGAAYSMSVQEIDSEEKARVEKASKESGSSIHTDLLVVATGNHMHGLPATLRASLKAAGPYAARSGTG